MTTTKKFVSLSALLILAMVAILPMAMHPVVPQINLPSNVGMQIVDDGLNWEAIVALEARHSDPTHGMIDPKAQAQVQTAIERWQVVTTTNPGGQDPESLVCKVVRMLNGMKYVAIWTASVENPIVGTVSVYNESNGSWITSYEGKSLEMFKNGKPHASVDSQIVPCNNIMPPGLPG